MTFISSINRILLYIFKKTYFCTDKNSWKTNIFRLILHKEFRDYAKDFRDDVIEITSFQ